MKLLRNWWLSGLSMAFFCLVLSCSGGGDSSSPSDAGDTGLTELSADELFYATMQDTTPVYSLITRAAPRAMASARASEELLRGADWGEDPGNLLYSVFFTLREYQYPRDEGVVDRSNFYKLLFDAESVLSRGYDLADALPEPVQIDAPFAGIDTSGSSFSMAANNQSDQLSIAYSDSEDTLEALMTWKWTETENPDKAERGIAYYVLDKVTRDVTIDMTFSVDYDTATPETEYNLRCKATGNAIDHSFEFNYLIGTTAIIAKGVSQGDGNYVIFKYGNGDGTYYLRVPAGSGESFFMDLFDAGAPAVTDPGLLDDENDYLTWIEAQPFMSQGDLLTTTEDLNIGIEGSAGTINLVY